MYYQTEKNSRTRQYDKITQSPKLYILHQKTPSNQNLKSYASNSQEASKCLKQRIHSQKKLSLTCKDQSFALPFAQNEFSNSLNHQSLRKQGKITLNLGKINFTSLKNSHVYQQNIQNQQNNVNICQNSSPVIQKPNEKFEYKNQSYILELAALKSFTKQKIQELVIENKQKQKELNTKLQRLESILFLNKQQLKRKDSQINQFRKINIQKQNQIDFLRKKVEDMEIKINILINCHQNNTLDINQKLERITDQINLLIQGKLLKCDNILNKFIQSNEKKIKRIQPNSFVYSQVKRSMNSLTFLVEQLRSSIQKIQSKVETENTEGGSSDSFFDKRSENNEQISLSFADDYFFYPQQWKALVNVSESVKAVTQIAKRHGQALNCWLDSDRYLRYQDLNTYLYDYNGKKINLSEFEIALLKDNGYLQID